MAIPILLFHKSEHIHVSYALRAAKKHNAIVTIITDVNAKIYSDYATVEQVSNYPSLGAEQLSGIYCHLSSNSYVFEYTAIEKYFYLLEHMKKNGLQKIIYLDSDVILYENLTRIIDQYFSAYDLCFSMPAQQHDDLFWSASGHLSLWTFEAMEKFTEFILDIYTNRVSVFEPKWNWHLQNNIPGGINDMTLIYLFQRETQLKTASFLGITDNRFSFDNSIKSDMNEFTNEYEMHSSWLLGSPIKKISFRNGYPYAYNLIKQKKILFYSLHFQGDAKRIMPLFIPGNKKPKEYISNGLLILRLLYLRLRKIIANKNI